MNDSHFDQRMDYSVRIIGNLSNSPTADEHSECVKKSFYILNKIWSYSSNSNKIEITKAMNEWKWDGIGMKWKEGIRVSYW